MSVLNGPSARARRGRRIGVFVILAAVLTLGVSPAQALDGPYPFDERMVFVAADRQPLRGDFDGDGRDDLIFYRGQAATDGIWYGRSDGQVDPRALGAGAGFDPFVGDFDGDGIDDVVLVRTVAFGAGHRVVRHPQPLLGAHAGGGPASAGPSGGFGP
ncbi:MAG: FG-GAP-like repeat-containing protein [Acidimicrobiales bacterium]